MKVTKEAEDAFFRALGEGEVRAGTITHALQAMMDHLFPPPGDNPLAANLAPERSTPELHWLRMVLSRADTAVDAVRRSSGIYSEDPEKTEILTTLANVRKVLQPWASRAWSSQNVEDI